jgi:dienelactone hydrolase
MGYSTGAATVVQHAPHDPRVAGVIAQAPFLSMTAAVRSFRRKLGAWICEEQLLRGFEQVAHAYGFDVKDSDTFSAIQQLQAPLLLVVGDCDSHLPPEEHFQPLAAAASPGLVKLLIVPGANHLSIYMRTWPDLDRAIGDFCDTVK